MHKLSIFLFRNTFSCATPVPTMIFSTSTLILLLFLIQTCSLSANTLTGETGRLIGTNQNSQTATRSGPIFVQDSAGFEKLRRFNHERIPERVVHAQGAGAIGTFISFADLSNLTTASLFRPGKETEVFARFSTVSHSKHSPETLRDPRGFAVKFKTDEGNWDLVGNNLPVFFIRDHLKFPDLIHAVKPDPTTNRQEPERMFDFFSALGGMATHMITQVYTDLGIPKSYRFMDGNSVHAYKLVKSREEFMYVKFRWFTNQGVQNLTLEQAREIQGRDFGHATKDLYDAIRAQNYPSWNLSIQLLSPDDLDKFDFDPLDATKIWPESIAPFMHVGKMTLNKVPPNFHLFTEQSAFSPANFLSGAIEPSEDRLLQGRLLSYHETQTHRLGSNSFTLLPVNRPKSAVRTYNQDGVMTYRHAWEGSVNYEPNNGDNSYREDSRYLYSTKNICGQYVQEAIAKRLEFRQAGELYRSLSVSQRSNLVENLKADLGRVLSSQVKNIMCAHFFKADEEYGLAVARAVSCNVAFMRKWALEKLRE